MKYSHIKTIASATLVESLRNKLLYGLLVAAFLVTAMAFFMSTVSLEQNARVLMNLGIFSIQLFTVFIVIFSAVSILKNDFERRTLYLLFPKPISRSEYVLGQFLALVSLSFLTLLLLGGVFTLGTLFIDTGLWSGLLLNIFCIFLEMILISALSLLFGSFASPLNAAMYSAGFYIIGHSLLSVKEYADRLGGTFFKGFINISYYLLPNLDKFDFKQEILYSVHIPPVSILWAILYCVIYTTLLLYLTTLAIKVREV